MGGYGRKGPSETEAVRKEDVRPLHTELLPVEVLAVEDVPCKGFRGRDIGVRRIPGASGDMPPALPDVLFHQVILLREIFLHPRILYPALEIEDVVRIFLQEEKVPVHGLGDILADRPLDIPVPLGIKMRVGNKVCLVFRLFLGKDCRRAEEKGRCYS